MYGLERATKLRPLAYVAQLSWLLLACRMSDADVEHGLDPDGDGFGPEEDCGPMDATVYPGAEEVCGDGVVNDCSGSEDEARAKCRLQGLMSLAQADLRLVGESAEDSIGFSVANAGDLDLNGSDEQIIGAPGLNNFGLNDGGAYVLSYSPQTNERGEATSIETSATKLLGEDGAAFSGHVVSGGQDVDGDGRPDLLVGAPYKGDPDQRQGVAHLILSHHVVGIELDALNLNAIDLELVGQSPNDEAGFATSFAGDVDGDGRSDVLIGARFSDLGGQNAGTGYLLLTSGALDLNSSALGLDSADMRFVGEGELDETAFALAGAGDVDGDGLDDVLIGSPDHDIGEPDVGAAYLMLSSGTLSSREQSINLSDADKKFIGEAPSRAGKSVAGPGDVDGDGYADLLIGAPHLSHTGDEEGAAYVLFADSITASSAVTFPLTSADLKFVGEESWDLAGCSVAGIGDADGDGRADALIGAMNQDTGGSNAGAAYLLLSSGALSGGPTTTSLSNSDLKLVGEQEGGYAGYAVSTAGDVNGDGLDDILIGAPGHADSAGAAYLLFGRSY